MAANADTLDRSTVFTKYVFEVQFRFYLGTIILLMVQIFFDAAIEDAKRLDAYFAEHQKPVGPLHGLPVSLKDQFHVKGVETTMVCGSAY